MSLEFARSKTDSAYALSDPVGRCTGLRNHGGDHPPLALLAVPRMEIELTSCREDGSWTWRAVGAREPRGVLEAILLPDGASTGDHLRVDTEQDVDGLLVTAVLPARATRDEPERLELLGSGQSQPEVTTTLARRKGRRRDSDSPDGDRRDGRRGDRRGHRGDDRDRPERGGPSRDRAGRKPVGRRKDRTTGEAADHDKDRTDTKPARRRKTAGRQKTARGGTGEGKIQPPRKAAPKDVASPRPRRLRPKRKHRKAVLADLPEEQKRLADIVLRSGVPGLRNAVEDQNASAREAGQPEIPPDILLRLAERIHPTLRTAEWLDRAEAAVSGVDEIDLRDLRSVVVASESVGRNDHTRALADQLRLALTVRVEREHSAWVSDVTKAIDESRGVRALRLSSRPPKAGAPLPEPILVRLTEIANNGLSGDVNQGRWGTLLDAVALSPVHRRVVPVGLPEHPSQELLDLVRRIGIQVPQIAALFGVEPTSAPRRRPGRGRARA